MSPSDPAARRHVRWEAPARAERIRELRKRVARFAREAGMSEARVMDLQVAVSEALTNAVVHAYPSPDSQGEMYVEAERCGSELLVNVRDRGIGMRPRLDSPGLGWGLRMIDALAHGCEVHLCRDGGTEVRMSFELDPAPRTGVVKMTGRHRSSLLTGLAARCLHVGAMR